MLQWVDVTNIEKYVFYFEYSKRPAFLAALLCILKVGNAAVN